jgi:hypothetical protein
MRITRKSDTVMVLRDLNTVGIILGSFFILLGLMMLKPDIISLHRDIPIFITIIFILLGLLSIFLPTVDLIIFDKSANLLTVKHRSLLLNDFEKCNLEQIRQIKLLIIPQNFPDSPVPFYRLVCVLQDGKEIMLNPTKSSFYSAGIGLSKSVDVPAKNIGQEIAIFLGVSFEEERRSKYQTDFYLQHRPE